MAFNIQCPYCGSLLEVPEQWIGTECGCPECGRTFVVPAPTPPPGVQPRPAYRQSPPPYEPPPRPYGGRPYKPNTGNTAKGEGENIPCLILGYAGIITPLLGIPVNIIGLILGIRRKYTVGIILNIVGLCIALFLTGIFAWSWLAHGTGSDSSITVKLNLHDERNNHLEPHYLVYLITDEENIDKAADLYKKLLEKSNGVRDPGLCKDPVSFYELQLAINETGLWASRKKTSFESMRPGESKTFRLKKGQRCFIGLLVYDIRKNDGRNKHFNRIEFYGNIVGGKKFSKCDGYFFEVLRAEDGNKTLEITNADLWLFYE